MPEDCLGGCLLSLETERREALLALEAELLPWAGEALDLR